jgi:hypothetical protein
MVESPIMRVHPNVYDKAEEIAQERDITMKAAIRDVFKEAGYEV